MKPKKMNTPCLRQSIDLVKCSVYTKIYIYRTVTDVRV